MSEKAILVALETPRQPLDEGDLGEMVHLAMTAGASVVETVIQRRNTVDPAYFIGKGKAEELRGLLGSFEADLVIVASDLSPAQAANLEVLLDCKVVDRTQLILDIFAMRARTKEGQLQVELAQLTYLLPRLSGKGRELSRLGGGIGTRGPGETKLEVDRRTIRGRISDLWKDIDEVGRHRALHRKARKDVPLAVCALVGYTNAGKSTLLRSLTGADVLVENKLFATLDPTTRRITLPNRQEVLLTDTVGFIRQIPPHLVAAFRATLEEVTEADILVHVVDAGHPRFEEQIKAVNDVLEALSIREKPIITVLNKMDTVKDTFRDAVLRDYPNPVCMSALRGEGIGDLLEMIQGLLAVRRKTIRVKVPYSGAGLLDILHAHGRVLREQFTNDFIEIEAEMDEVWADRILSRGELWCKED